MLNFPPTLNHISRAYFELGALGARAVGEKKKWPYSPTSKEELLALTAEMSRFDPRLFDILVEFLFFHWMEFNPQTLRNSIRTMPSPQVFGVIGSFLESCLDDHEVVYFFEYLMRGYSPVSPRLFFCLLYAPASRAMQKASCEPLQEYLSWGFLARERPIIHAAQRKELGHFSREARHNMIARLLTDRGQISLMEYLEALNHTLSRQQALLDLKEFPGLQITGKGRGSVWIKK